MGACTCGAIVKNNSTAAVHQDATPSSKHLTPLTHSKGNEKYSQQCYNKHPFRNSFGWLVELKG